MGLVVKPKGDPGDKGDERQVIAHRVEPSAEAGGLLVELSNLAVAAVDDRDRLEQEPGDQEVSIAPEGGDNAGEDPQQQVEQGDLIGSHPQARQQDTNGQGYPFVEVSGDPGIRVLEDLFTAFLF